LQKNSKDESHDVDGLMETVTYCPYKEDAESWKFYLDGGLNGLMDIKERLKKYIEQDAILYNGMNDNDLKKELQKILGEK